MTAAKWASLYEWCVRVFGAEDGRALFREHVAEAESC